VTKTSNKVYILFLYCTLSLFSSMISCLMSYKYRYRYRYRYRHRHRYRYKYKYKI